MKRIPYDQEPDFSRAPLELPGNVKARMQGRLAFLYGDAMAEFWQPELERILRVHHAHKPLERLAAEQDYDVRERFTEKDCILITYGDSVPGEHETSLKALHRFIKIYNRGTVNTIHLLPFFPYSSDRGFAVVDFKDVDPSMGTWQCIRDLGTEYDLMFDGVLNHCSSRSEMFQQFLSGNPYYKEFFIAYDSPDDLTADQRSKIFRPRTSDILTRFETIDGPKYVWTTFSDDQIDLNFRNPQVLMAVVDALLFYVRQGADILRLDAVTYLWCEPGTECVHLPQTHEVVKLLRDVMDAVAPGVAILTETNVPHEQNISYFGKGNDEAHMVYNFALPPMVLHTIYSQDATELSRWAQRLETNSDTATFFNMLDTHDGIGVMGVKGILAPEAIDALVQRAQSHGALIGYKSTEQGEVPYEINSTWWSAINRADSTEEMSLQVKRFVASRAIAMVIKGVPGIYTHGAAAMANDRALADKTGVKRDINRSVIDPERLARELQDPASKRALYLRAYGDIGLIRTGNRAFHPQGTQTIFTLHPGVFSVLRECPDGRQRIFCLIGVSEQACSLSVPLERLGVPDHRWQDLTSGDLYQADEGLLRVEVAPYEVIWLTPDPLGGS